MGCHLLYLGSVIRAVLSVSNSVVYQVDCMHTAVAESKAKDAKPVRISVLLDYMRGSRGVKNSRTMLLPLLKEFPLSVTVALFHTPNLRGTVRRLLPERYNETFGVNHIKAYIFDDTIVISG